MDALLSYEIAKSLTQYRLVHMLPTETHSLRLVPKYPSTVISVHPKTKCVCYTCANAYWLYDLAQIEATLTHSYAHVLVRPNTNGNSALTQ